MFNSEVFSEVANKCSQMKNCKRSYQGKGGSEQERRY